MHVTPLDRLRLRLRLLLLSAQAVAGVTADSASLRLYPYELDEDVLWEVLTDMRLTGKVSGGGARRQQQQQQEGEVPGRRRRCRAGRGAGGWVGGARVRGTRGTGADRLRLPGV